MNLEKGAAVGPYIVRGLLAEGGMAVLFHADVGREYRTRGGPKRVVLKIAKQEREDALKEEADFLKRFDHPGIVQIYPLPLEGRTEYVARFETAVQPGGRRPYLVLEHVAGGTLADQLERHGRLPVAGVVAIGRQLALALEHVHSKGVLARDIKPSNVLFRRRPWFLWSKGLRVVLCDFGIALDRQRPHAGEPSAGTFAYMSPEQVRRMDNRQVPIDAPSDVYALGVVMYEMLTGHTPFGGDVSLIVDPAVTAVPPSRVRHGVPAPLEAVVMHALAKSPQQRIPSAGALAAILAGLPRKVKR